MLIGGRKIGSDQPAYIVCEAGVTNYGDMKLALQQVDASVRAGADAVKFQAWRTENLVSSKVSRRLESELGFNWFERMKSKELSFEQLRELQSYCASRNITFFATPHDYDALDFLVDDLNVPVVKVGSGEAANLEFLRKVGAKRKPVFISFGMQSREEMKTSIETLKSAGATDIACLHCVSIYPTPASMADLPAIEKLRSFGMPVGISDHSVGWHIVLAATVFGASIVEKHLTFDKQDPRSLDNPGALLPEEFVSMVQQVREIEQAGMAVPESKRLEAIAATKSWATQSIMAKVDIPAGSVISSECIAFKRPGHGGLPAAQVDLIVGRKTKVFIGQDQQILFEHLL